MGKTEPGQWSQTVKINKDVDELSVSAFKDGRLVKTIHLKKGVDEIRITTFKDI